MKYVNEAAVIALASSLSEKNPAKIPPITPPISKKVDKFPAVSLDRYSPPISAINSLIRLSKMTRTMTHTMTHLARV